MSSQAEVRAVLLHMGEGLSSLHSGAERGELRSAGRKAHLDTSWGDLKQSAEGAACFLPAACDKMWEDRDKWKKELLNIKGRNLKS